MRESVMKRMAGTPRAYRGRRRAALLLAAALVAGTLAVGPPAVADPSGVVVDGFARPDSAVLGSALTGQSWSVWSGAAGVVGETAKASVSGYTLAVLDSGCRLVRCRCRCLLLVVSRGWC
ncbi:MAG: hypothetical protein M5U19_00740 [Microthrixaceae bacterium]|nr:hypothetical protein [Microthrixaceae bacterium]